MGRAEGSVVRHERQAARREGRGPPARVRRLRGDHSAPATTAPAASSSGTAASGSPLEDWREGLEKGKLLFELRGYKLHGKWTLVKIKKSEKDWLLIKERDAYVKSPGDMFVETSVLSGLTVDEVKAGKQPRAGHPRGDRESRRAAQARRSEDRSRSCSPSRADDAFTRDGWLFELKLDGYRLHRQQVARRSAAAHAKRQRLHRRSFPRSRARSRRCRSTSASSTAKSSCSTPQGKPSFSRLQQRGRLSVADRRQARGRRAARRRSSRSTSSRSRTSICGRCRSSRARRSSWPRCPKLGAVRALDHIEREGEAFLAQVDALGLEGIIAKRADAPYRGGRTRQLAQDQGGAARATS